MIEKIKEMQIKAENFLNYYLELILEGSITYDAKNIRNISYWLIRKQVLKDIIENLREWENEI